MADHGEKALDIFSNFFICPEFSKSGTQREVQAVDSENSKNLVNDGRRRWQVLKSLADPQHHFSKFSTGNRITLPACATGDSDVGGSNVDLETGSITPGKHPLKDILRHVNGGKHDEIDMAEFVRAALLAFHKRHYTPENMSAVMIGPQSLDELEAWVVPRFGRIPGRWLNRDDDNEVKEGEEDDDNMLDKNEKWHEMQRAAAKLVDESASDAPRVSIHSAEPVKHHSAFRPDLQGGQWPVVVTTKPLKDIRKLVLFFPLPPTWRNPDRSPTSVLSHLFGHEGPGSAFALLQNKGWITTLNAGNRVHAPDQCLFKIEMTLTAEGEKHWAEATGVIFDYGRMLRHAADESMKSDEGNANCHDGHKELRRIWGKIFLLCLIYTLWVRYYSQRMLGIADEVVSLEKMRFHQTSPGAVYSFASSVAESISIRGTEICLSAGSMLNENGDSLPLKEMLDFARQIRPRNCLIERYSNEAWEDVVASYQGTPGKLENDRFDFGLQTEKWYGVDYYVSPVDREQIERWETNSDDELVLHLPKPNRYIPRTLSLSEDLPEEAKVQRIEKSIEPPELIVDKPTGKSKHFTHVASFFMSTFSLS